MTRNAARKLRRLALWILLAVSAAHPARAQEPLQAQPSLSGVPLGAHTSVLRDPTGTLTLDAVRSEEVARRFEPVADDLPTFGLNTDAFWFRFRVQNRNAAARSWLLELAYPHHDSVDLYIPSGDGYRREHRGDLRPFHERAIDHPNFLFDLEEPARSTRTYYLRIQTTGSVSVPLVAWDTHSFVAHQLRDEAGNWLFYGIVLVMAAYNGVIFLFMRQQVYLLYTLYNLSILLFSFSIKGHAFAVLFPNHPQLANHLIPFALAQTFTWTTGFLREYLDFKTHFPRLDPVFRGAAWLCALLSVLALVLPYAVAVRAVAIVGACLTFTTPLFVAQLIRRGVRAARIYALGWGALILGAALYMAKLIGVLPGSYITEWGMQIGASLEVVVLSLALADSINALRSDLAKVNDQLSLNIGDLRAALAEARAATKAKSEFVATMSHELRTPLNAIINLPQGMLEDFPSTEAVACAHCSSVFELDEGDEVGPSTPCPECARPALQRERIIHYVGTPLETAGHLSTIERAGRHLLDMVNNILDFSKLEADRMELDLTAFPIARIIEDAVEPIAVVAHKRHVNIVLEPTDEDLWIHGDPVRLKQVLINLVGNAIKFSPPQSTVRVGARRDRSACVVHVRDEGIGIAPEDQARIFRSFEQVHQGDTRKYGGTGLGLSISATLIAKHQGHMWVDSEPGRGSTFFFSVPVVKQPETAEEQKSPLTPRSSRPPADAPLHEGSMP